MSTTIRLAFNLTPMSAAPSGDDYDYDDCRFSQLEQNRKNVNSGGPQIRSLSGNRINFITRVLFTFSICHANQQNFMNPR